MNKPLTTFNHQAKDDEIYIKHESESFKFEITQKAFKKLTKTEQKNLIKLASRNFEIER